MNTRLNLDDEIVKEAKSYAKKNNMSLSKLIENYLNSLTKYSAESKRTSLLVESLTGVIPNEADERKDLKMPFNTTRH